MRFSLFPDQIEFKRNLGIELNRYGSIIGCAATGFGKTIVFTEIADGYRSAKPKNSVLVLTESIKIYNQTAEELNGNVIQINANVKDPFLPLEEGCIIIAMSQTLARRPKLLERIQEMGNNLLMLIDEGHIGTQNSVIRELPTAKKICFTATPDARWAKHLPEFYRSIVVGPQPSELIHLGRLEPYKHFARVSADLGKLTVKGGEFTEESQEAVFGTAKVFDGLVEDLRTIKYQKALIFCASIADCEMEHGRLSAAGFKCVRVHTNRSILTEEEEAYQLGQFMTTNDHNICISVGTMTKGYDFPPVDLVVLRRATTSLPLYIQMCGRGGRVCNERVINQKGFNAWGCRPKKGWVCLDYGHNFLRFGLWDMDREWEEVWNKPSKQKEGVAPIKICPQCEYVMPNQASVCPNCGFEFVKKPKEVEPGKLIEITEAFSKLAGKTMSQLLPEELAIYSNFKNKRNFAARVAKALDRKTPGYLEKFAAAMGYKPSWVDHARRLVEGQDVQFPDYEIR